MKLEKFALQLFEDKNEKTQIDLEIPQGSTLLKAKLIHDGIYLWYSVSELEVPTEKKSFVILKPNQSIPNNSTFIDIVDAVVETPQGQGIMIFPIYQLN